VAELSEWLKVMLGEVARKREEQARAAAEQQLRSGEHAPAATEPKR
jgi:hypothetical protein